MGVNRITNNQAAERRTSAYQVWQEYCQENPVEVDNQANTPKTKGLSSQDTVQSYDEENSDLQIWQDLQESHHAKQHAKSKLNLPHLYDTMQSYDSFNTVNSAKPAVTSSQPASKPMNISDDSLLRRLFNSITRQKEHRENDIIISNQKITKLQEIQKQMQKEARELHDKIAADSKSSATAEAVNTGLKIGVVVCAVIAIGIPILGFFFAAGVTALVSTAAIVATVVGGAASIASGVTSMIGAKYKLSVGRNTSELLSVQRKQEVNNQNVQNHLQDSQGYIEKIAGDIKKQKDAIKSDSEAKAQILR